MIDICTGRERAEPAKTNASASHQRKGRRQAPSVDWTATPLQHSAGVGVVTKPTSMLARNDDKNDDNDNDNDDDDDGGGDDDSRQARVQREQPTLLLLSVPLCQLQERLHVTDKRTKTWMNTDDWMSR